MLRKSIPAGVLLALLAGPAGAQNMNLLPDFSRHQTAEDRQRDREIESKYRETVEGMPDKKASKDPWGNVRSAPAAKQPASGGKQARP